MRLSTQLVAGEAQHLAAPRLVLPHRGDDQHRRGANPAGHERQEPQAHLVGPVQVLEPQHDRLRRPELLDHVDHALEQAQAVARGRGPTAPATSGTSRPSSARHAGFNWPSSASSPMTRPVRKASTQGPNGRICSLS